MKSLYFIELIENNKIFELLKNLNFRHDHTVTNAESEPIS